MWCVCGSSRCAGGIEGPRGVYVCRQGEAQEGGRGMPLAFQALLPSHFQVKEPEALGGEPCSEGTSGQLSEGPAESWSSVSVVWRRAARTTSRAACGSNVSPRSQVWSLALPKVSAPVLNPRALAPLPTPLPCTFSPQDTVWTKLRRSRKVALSTTTPSRVQVGGLPLASAHLGGRGWLRCPQPEPALQEKFLPRGADHAL